MTQFSDSTRPEGEEGAQAISDRELTQEEIRFIKVLGSLELTEFIGLLKLMGQNLEESDTGELFNFEVVWSKALETYQKLEPKRKARLNELLSELEEN